MTAILLTVAMALCGAGPRITCVVDGDTVWIAREKIRLEGIDAPEVSEPHCSSELARGQAAKRRLAEILADHVTIERNGTDRYGRTLARLRLPDGRTAGEILVGEGLARHWTGRRESWCGQ